MLTGDYIKVEPTSAHPSLATADECYAAAKEQYPNAPYIQFKDSKTKCDWCCQVKGLSVGRARVRLHHRHAVRTTEEGV